MADYKDSSREEHLELVRQAVAVNPNCTARQVSDSIEKETGRKLSVPYIYKLRDKLRGERIHRYDKAAVLVRIADMEDRVRRIHAEMWAIVLDKRAPRESKIKAATLIAKSDRELFDAQLDAGIFERKLGTLDVAPDLEKFAPVIHAFANFGLIRKAKIIEADVKKRTTGITN